MRGAHGVFLGIALVVAGVVAAAFLAMFFAVLIGIAALLHGLGQLGDISVFPPPSPAELDAAATTSTIPAAGCWSLAAIAPSADGAQHMLASDTRDAAWRPRMTFTLAALDRTVQQAVRFAEGPMRTHLVRVHDAVAHSEAALRAGGDAATVFDDAFDGYRELLLANQLLGTACGVTLAPDLDLTPPTTRLAH